MSRLVGNRLWNCSELQTRSLRLSSPSRDSTRLQRDKMRQTYTPIQKSKMAYRVFLIISPSWSSWSFHYFNLLYATCVKFCLIFNIFSLLHSLWTPGNYAGRLAIMFCSWCLFFSFFSPPNLRGRSVDRHQTLPHCRPKFIEFRQKFGGPYTPQKLGPKISQFRRFCDAIANTSRAKTARKLHSVLCVETWICELWSTNREKYDLSFDRPNAISKGGSRFVVRTSLSRSILHRAKLTP